MHLRQNPATFDKVVLANDEPKGPFKINCGIQDLAEVYSKLPVQVGGQVGRAGSRDIDLKTIEGNLIR